MVWFKVDDKLHDHHKVRQAGASAMGLWVLAGSWSADNLTDGYVAETVLRRWDHNWRVRAERLVRAGLWSAETVNGEPGYRFHQWQERQPTRSDVEKGRESDRQRMAETRAAKKPRSETVRSTRPDPYPTRPVVPSEQPRADKRVPAESTATKRVKDAAAAYQQIQDSRDRVADNGYPKELQ